ncbi:MAG: hypothetical protein DRH26_12090 [Deltaproteobacteria bacterium]|nr:MAG: hypothetical protein DRH26_12090 [Deltaproteobacteria bacterium]
MEIQLNDAKCTGLSLLAPVELAKEDETGNKFLIEAYTGEVVERWWGMLVIDVDGIKAKKQIPVLMNHNAGLIVGHSTKTYKDGSFFVSGQFSEVTEKAREVKGLAKEGFPWQASIGVRPVKILSIEKDGKTEVNGKTLKGPAEIWLESEVFETSFVPLGADDNTSVSTFSKFEEKQAPTGVKTKIHNKKELKLMDITLEQLAKDAPDLLARIQTEARQAGYDEGLKVGATTEVARIKDVLGQSMPGHEDLVDKLAFDGKTTGPDAAVQILAAEKKIRENKKEDLDDDAQDPVDHAVPKDKDNKIPATEEEFNTHAKLKKEFGSFDVFQAYQESMADGLVKTINKKE